MSSGDIPQLGDIGVVTSPGFVSWAIRKITRSPVSHAFIYAGDGLVLEGWSSGLRWNKVSAYPDVVWLTNLSRNLTPVQRADIVAWMRAHLGTPYSFLDDAEIAFVDLFHWAPHFMRDRLRSDATLMCSQACVASYREAAHDDLFPTKPAGAVSPGDMWKLNRSLA